MSSEEFECLKCGNITPVRVCPNCGLGTVWKNVPGPGRGRSTGTLTHVETRSDKKNLFVDFLIIVLSVVAPLLGLKIASSALAATVGIGVGLFNWFLAPYARLRILQIMDKIPYPSTFDSTKNPLPT
jgi:hypothetical protein